MTSKYILLLGSLLFLLLVTSCIAFFLDRYHPNLTAQMPAKEMTIPVTEKRSQSGTPPEGADLFLHEIPIDTLPATQEHPENGTEERAFSQGVHAAAHKTKAETPVISATPTIEHNITHTAPTTAPTVQIAAKKSIPQKRVAASVPKRLTPANKSKPLPRALTVQGKLHPKTLSRERQKVIIEPVLLVKTLSVSPSGRLYRWDKPFLEDVARLVKAEHGRLVLLRAEADTGRSRTYLQHIRRYLIRHGVPQNRIRSEEQSRRKGENIQATLHDLTIELSVIERN